MSSKVYLAAIFLLGVTVLVMTGLGLPPGHSTAFNFAWSSQYSQAVSWADPMPRYVPGLWAGFGGHDFFFYAPLPFWVIGALVAPLCGTCSAETELVFGAALFLAASALSMFAFLRSSFGAPPALVGALVYVFLPYHFLLDWFERQAIGEFAAFAFLPLIALGVERVRQGTGGGAILALGVAGTALSHLPTALLAGHVFAVVCLVFTFAAPGGWADRLWVFARFAWFAALGLLLSAFYWLPAVMLLDSVSSSVLFDPYFEAWRWLYGVGTTQPNPGFAVRVLLCFVVAVPIVLASLTYTRGATMIWIVVPVAFVALMNMTVSEPIWRNWIIGRVQFPWRMMSFVDLATAVAVAVLAARAMEQGAKRLAALALAVAVLPYGYLAGTIIYSLPGVSAAQVYTDWVGGAEYLSPETSEVLRARMGREELTHFDQTAIATAFAEMVTEFNARGVGAEILDRTPRSLTVQPAPDTEVLSLPVQYWFLWQAETGSGAALQTRANADFGTLDVLAPTGGFDGGEITVFLPYHRSEVWGAGLSVFALVLLFAGHLRSAAARRLRNG